MTTAAENPVANAHPDFCLGAEALKKLSETALTGLRQRLDELAALPEAQRTFASTMQAFDRILGDFSTLTAATTFPKYISTDPEVREAAHASETEISKFMVDLFAREDLYAALKSCSPDAAKLAPRDRKLLDWTLRDFQRNGLDLEPLEKTRFGILKKQLLDMELTFGKNLNEIKDFLPVTREELDGLPKDYIERLERTKDGKYKVTMDYPDYIPFITEAHSGDARRRLEHMFHNRAVPDNAALLEEIFPLRRRLAGMLGFKSHAHFVMAEMMAKEPEQVTAFQSRLRERLQEPARRELTRLLDLKKKDDPQANKIEAWDFGYYHNKLKKTEYDVDETKIMEYFPMRHVLDRMFEVYQSLLGVRFEKMVLGDEWHADVEYYETADAESGEPLGRFYLDLFPRDGKFKHAAVFPLVPGFRRSDGAYHLPLVAMVANFNKPTKDKPSLLRHNEVVTLFHEFGHVMHGVLTRAEHSRFAGTGVVRDFVEAPSQMLENWVWRKEVLRELSSHFQSGKPLPDDVLERKLAAKNLNSACMKLRQLAYGMIDQAYHLPEPAAAQEAFHRIHSEVALVESQPGTRPEASFGHLVGYDASYYSYLWAEVFSEDMFSVFAEAGVLDPAVGKRYRKTVLERGGEGDEKDYVREFLGREPNEEAFLKSIGLT